MLLNDESSIVLAFICTTRELHRSTKDTGKSKILYVNRYLNISMDINQTTA